MNSPSDISLMELEVRVNGTFRISISGHSIIASASGSVATNPSCTGDYLFGEPIISSIMWLSDPPGFDERSRIENNVEIRIRNNWDNMIRSKMKRGESLLTISYNA